MNAFVEHATLPNINHSFFKHVGCGTLQLFVQRFVSADDADVACSPCCDCFFITARLVGFLVVDVTFLLEALLPEREATAPLQNRRDEVLLFGFLYAQVVQFFDVRRSAVILGHDFECSLRRLAVTVDFA